MGSPFLLLAIVALIVGAFLPAAQANAPAPAPSSVDQNLGGNPYCNLKGIFMLTSQAQLEFRTSIDQGIAYILMLVALILTYLIHPLDASSPYKLF